MERETGIAMVREEMPTRAHAQNVERGKRNCAFRGALRISTIRMIVLMLFLSTAFGNANSSHVVGEAAEVQPRTSVQGKGGRRRLSTITPLTNDNIHQAVNAWLDNVTSARQTYGDIAGWNTSGVTDMSNLFCADGGCGDKMKSAAASFNGNLSEWDVGKVTTLERTFSRANAFNSDISSWDVSRVENMEYAFYSANNFNADISRWNTSRVTSLSQSKCIHSPPCVILTL